MEQGSAARQAIFNVMTWRGDVVAGLVSSTTRRDRLP